MDACSVIARLADVGDATDGRHCVSDATKRRRYVSDATEGRRCVDQAKSRQTTAEQDWEPRFEENQSGKF